MATEPTPLSHCIQDREIGVLGAGLERCRAILDKHDAAINKLDRESRELALQQIENISEFNKSIAGLNLSLKTQMESMGHAHDTITTQMNYAHEQMMGTISKFHDTIKELDKKLNDNFNEIEAKMTRNSKRIGRLERLRSIGISLIASVTIIYTVVKGYLEISAFFNK